jgi:serine phosphatase RsbU (regulator of sigma subunit)
MVASAPPVDDRMVDALAALHGAGSDAEADAAFLAMVAAIAPGAPAAVCLFTDGGDGLFVRSATPDCPLQAGETLGAASWPQPEQRRLALRIRGEEFGELRLGGDVDAAVRLRLGEAAAHYAAAIANLALLTHARSQNARLGAKLMAVEEAIPLFQEDTTETVHARLLQVAANVVEAMAGALYVLEEVGRTDSSLRLAHAIGIPESLLASFESVDGGSWPLGLLDGGARIERRSSDDEPLASLAPSCTPAHLHGVVVLPLAYSGICAGVCVLFNPALPAGEEHLVAERMESFLALAAALLHRLDLERRAIANQSLERELEIAAQIQKCSLPTEAPTASSYDFAWASTPAQRIGGDHIDWLAGSGGEVHAVVADASGHGINSALLMTSYRANWRGSAPWLETSALAERLNGTVAHEVGSTGMFVTAVLFRLAADGSTVTLCNAGHTPVLHWRAASGTIAAIPGDGPPLGFLPDAAYGEREVPLAPGDTLLFYSDGLTEAAANGGAMLGDERLAAAFAAGAAGGTAADALAAIQRLLHDWTGRARQDDDVSIVVVKVRAHGAVP